MSARAADDVLDWATALAGRSTPDEIDLAPDMMTAYLGGGIERRRLFAAPRADPGAFGGGLALQFPYVLDSLVMCCSLVKQFIGDPAVNTVVASASLGAAIRQLRMARRPDPTPEPPPVQPAVPEAQDADVDVVDEARQALTALVDRLREHPATADQAEEAATAVLATVAADPPRALKALAALEAAPP